MLLALMVSLAVAAPTPAPARVVSLATSSDDPRIKVWLNHDDYRRGDKARVNVKLAEDGYLIVLRVDAEGRARVLFPLDPSDDAFIRGGETIEVRGRGDREAFYVDDRQGSGLVLAARATVPFKLDEFVRGDHWDYRVLDASKSGDDREAALLDIVQRMSPDGHFDYDVVKYFVSTQHAYSDSYYPSTYVSVGFGWGWPHYGWGFFSSCYDEFYWDPFYCGGLFRPYSRPYYYDPYGYGYYDPYGNSYYAPFRNRPYIYPLPYYGYGRPRVYFDETQGLFVNRLRNGTGRGLDWKDPAGTNVGVGGIGPRYRAPGDAGGTFISRTGGGSIPIRERTPTGRDVPVGSGGFTGRDHNDRPADRPGPGVRQPEPRDHSHDGERTRPDRPTDRPGPDVRQPESRDQGRGVDRSREQPAERPSPAARQPESRDQGRGFERAREQPAERPAPAPRQPEQRDQGRPVERSREQPAERPAPAPHQPEQRDQERPVERSREQPVERAPAPVPERSRDPGPSSAPRPRPPSGNDRSWSAPTPRMERAAPPSRRSWGGGSSWAGGGGGRSAGGGRSGGGGHRGH
jgi:uncharacterized membrane protein YgcG